MPLIKRSALLPYSAEFMYQLVNDIEAYPDFLPWCGGARVMHANDESMEASILISKTGMNHWFSTRNRLTPNQRIEMTLLEGPFERLDGTWRFSELADSGCKIELELDFETRRGLAAKLISPAFTAIANTLVDAFCSRARALNER